MVETQILKNDEWSLVVVNEGIVRKQIKDIRPYDRVWNKTISDAINRRVKALDILKGIEGVEKIISKESENTITSVYIPGTPLRKYNGKLPPEYFSELSKIVKKCCQKGVYNLDLNKSNLIVKQDLKPAIVDFGDCIFSDDNLALLSCIPLSKIYHSLRISALSKKYNPC